jgi:hypothetical protein
LGKKVGIVLVFKTTRHLEEGVVLSFGLVITNFSLLREEVVVDQETTTRSETLIWKDMATPHKV